MVGRERRKGRGFSPPREGSGPTSSKFTGPTDSAREGPSEDDAESLPRSLAAAGLLSWLAGAGGRRWRREMARVVSFCRSCVCDPSADVKVDAAETEPGEDLQDSLRSFLLFLFASFLQRVSFFAPSRLVPFGHGLLVWRFSLVTHSFG